MNMTKVVYGIAIECQDGFELFEDYAEAEVAYAKEKAKTIAEFNVWNDECVYLYELEIHIQDNTDDLIWFDFVTYGQRIDVKEGLCGDHIEEIY
jgi:hypothetical protein